MWINNGNWWVNDKTLKKFCSFYKKKNLSKNLFKKEILFIWIDNNLINSISNLISCINFHLNHYILFSSYKTILLFFHIIIWMFIMTIFAFTKLCTFYSSIKTLTIFFYTFWFFTCTFSNWNISRNSLKCTRMSVIS